MFKIKLWSDTTIMKKNILISILILTSLIPNAVFASTSVENTNDISQDEVISNHWAKNEILFAFYEGYLELYDESDNFIHPNIKKSFIFQKVILV